MFRPNDLVLVYRDPSTNLDPRCRAVLPVWGTFLGQTLDGRLLISSDDWNGIGHIGSNFPTSTPRPNNCQYVESENVLSESHAATATFECFGCHQLSPVELIRHTPNQKAICLSCYQKNRFCHHCGTSTKKSESLRRGRYYYCPSCYDQLFPTCFLCKERVFQNRTHINHWDGCRAQTVPCCRPCYESHVSMCHFCAAPTPTRETRTQSPLFEGDGEVLFCRRCFIRHARIPATTFERWKDPRFVGFEIEALAPHTRDNIAPMFEEYGVIKSDASLAGYRQDRPFHTFEFASRAACGDSLLNQVNVVCDLLDEINAYANNTCGFHVHLNMKGVPEPNRENIVEAWNLFEPVLSKLVNAKRRRNQYCASTEGMNYRQLSGCDRRRALNVASIHKHGTFEVRLHPGTVNRTKIKSWISFLIAFFRTFETLKFTPEQITEIRTFPTRMQMLCLLQLCPMPLSARKGIVARWKRYSSKRAFRRPGKSTRLRIYEQIRTYQSTLAA